MMFKGSLKERAEQAKKLAAERNKEREKKTLHNDDDEQRVRIREYEER